MSFRYDPLKFAEVQSLRGVLYLDCRHCRRYRFLPSRAVQVADRYSDRLLRALPFRCQHCGNQPWRIEVYVPRFFRYNR